MEVVAKKMEILFQWDVSQDSVIKTIELKGEFDQGEHYDAIKKSFKVQRKLERVVGRRRNFKCSFLRCKEGQFKVNRTSVIGSLLHRKVKTGRRTNGPSTFERINCQLQSVH